LLESCLHGVQEIVGSTPTTLTYSPEMAMIELNNLIMRLKDWLVADSLNEVFLEALKWYVDPAVYDPAMKDRNLQRAQALAARKLPNRRDPRSVTSPVEIVGAIRHGITNYDSELIALKRKIIQQSMCDQLREKNLFFKNTYDLVDKFIQSYLDNPQQYAAANNAWLRAHIVNDVRCDQDDEDPRQWRSGWRKTG
jgi:hypothetical protein